MIDILERLREFEHNWSDKLDMADACQDAADEIERNRAAIAELVGALQAIVNLDDGDTPDLWHFEADFNAARALIAKHQQPTTTEKE